jgi:hypothetical protein
LASLNPPEEDTAQASLSLEDAIEVAETLNVEDLTSIAQKIPDSAQGLHHD